MAKKKDADDKARTAARWPRLVDDHGAGEYLGVSRWTVRAWVAAGHLHPVPMPPLPAREGETQQDALKRVLLDLENLDHFVDTRKGKGQRTAVK